MEKKSYLEQLQDRVEKLGTMMHGVDDIDIAYIAGRLDAKAESLEKETGKEGK